MLKLMENNIGTKKRIPTLILAIAVLSILITAPLGTIGIKFSSEKLL